jgi:outer membrane protein OmpA-like peptidoglycan-associated protein
MTNFARVVSLPLLLVATTMPAGAFAQRVTFGGGGSTSGGASSTPKPAATTPSTSTAVLKEETKEAHEGDTAPPTKEWQDRDHALGESSTLDGGTGLLHTQHLQTGAPGQFRLGFSTEFFSSGFLCSTDQPCTDPRTGMSTTQNSTDHIGGTINLSVSILKWLEAYASTGAYANSNDKNRPSLLQVLGDTTFGAKGISADLAKIFHFGGFAEMRLVNGTGFVGLAGKGTSARFGIGATADVREVEERTTALGGILGRASLNIAYFVDNTGAVVEDTEKARGTPITRIERYGLKINRTDHFDLAFGYEMFFVDDRIRPFLEYNIAAPVNRQGYACKPNNPSGDKCLANEQIPQHKLTLGGRFLPWKNGFSALLAFDFGLPPSSTRFIEESAPTAPWMLYLGLGWAIDTWDRPPVEKIKTVQKVIEGKPPKRGKLTAFVHEKDKPDAIVGAQVSFDGHPELPTVLTGADGKFTSWELPEGEYKLTVKADGYKDGQCAGTLPKGGADGAADCPLEALPRVGTIIGHVRDAENLAPVPNATVKLTDGKGKTLQVTSDPQGGFRFEGVDPGAATLDVEADGYLVQVEPAEVKVRQEVTHDVSIRAKPKQSLVQVTKTEIQIKQQIQFALDQAIILPESTPLLTEIADTLIRNPRIKRVEVQGHTDNSGTPEHNQTLSEQRAEAVRKWLTDHGVASDRLVAKGYGQTKPLVPNVTAANKAKNRRVQFLILDQEPETPKGPDKGPGGKQPPPF